MLDDIQHDRVVESDQVQGERTTIEIVQLKGVDRVSLFERHRVDPCGMTAASTQRVTQISTGAPDIQHTGSRWNSVASQPVRALEVELRRIRPAVGGSRAAIKLAIVKNR